MQGLRVVTHVSEIPLTNGYDNVLEQLHFYLFLASSCLLLLPCKGKKKTKEKPQKKLLTESAVSNAKSCVLLEIIHPVCGWTVDCSHCDSTEWHPQTGIE